MVIKMNLSSLTAAAALAAALVAAASVLASSAMPDLFVWAAFIGRASYDRSGSAGGPAQLRCLVFGVVMGWAVPIVVVAGTLPLSASLTTAITAVVAAPISLMIGTALGVHRGGWRGYSLRARPAPRRNGALRFDGSPVAHGDSRKARSLQ
jgi:hypothetical protein